jgi:very-short-patch-repair endonuclease
MFLFICLDYGIPLPLVNDIHEGTEFDFRWPEQRLIVEVDGYKFHDGLGREHFESDRDKGLRADELGSDFKRFSAKQVARERARVARAVVQRLRP